MYGKIASILKTDGTLITYGYDASGNRITKAVKEQGDPARVTTTYYVRDAQGTVLGVYSDKAGVGFSWQEQHLYGSARLGMALPNLRVAAGQTLSSEAYASPGDPLTNGVVGLRRYELSNHLGNVLSVVSDRATGLDGGDGTIDYYTAEVLSAQDYYPFGMMMPGRQFSAGGGYRYGFNGKENDNEVKGDGNQYDYGFRIYDPRTGRFLSTDPLMGSYPWYTPYQFAGNTPIQAIDLDGLEEAYPRQAPKIPVLTNVSESTCQTCPARSAQIHRMQQQQAIENLRAEYQSWRMQPGNSMKPVPSKYISVVPKPGPEAVLTQGGYMGSDDYKITKARYDQTKEFLPGISDINDAYQSYEFGKKGQYGMMALSLVSLVPGADFITKPLKYAGKYADEAAKLVKHSGIIPGKKEILTITKTGLRTDAYKVATATIGDLGDDAIPLMGKSTSKYPDANKIVVGMQSADGSRGWRIDYDSEKGAHYNWFNNNTGEKGAVFFEGTADQVHYLKQQMTKSF